MDSVAGLTHLCKTTDVPANGVKQVLLASTEVEIAVYKLGDEFYATDDLCTHGLAFLSSGDVDEGQIFCPLHGGAFDIRTGTATAAPCRIALKTYKVTVVGEDVYAQIG